MPPLGTHILAELTGADPERLNDAAFLERNVVQAVQDAGATVVESTFSPFSPHGVTGLVLIQESHVALHTWPEHGYAALDVFTCGDQVAPEAIVDAVATAVRADATNRKIERGEGPPRIGAGEVPKHGAATRSVWFTDRQDNIALSLRHAGVLFAERSPYQKVEVLETYGYGRVLLLDDRVAFTERDEFVYHEMIAHVPALRHPDPKSVLVVGGGDGGACREFLKHDGIERITVVEIDPTVTEAARDHFPAMAASLDDPRVTLLHGDGAAYLDGSDATFDLIVVDGLDTAGETPFDSAFLSRVSAALSPGGLCVTQVVAPTVSPSAFAASVAAHAEAFSHASPYLGFLPTYSTGMLSFCLSQPPVDTRSAASLPDLEYVTDDILSSAFALPAFVRRALEE